MKNLLLLVLASLSLLGCEKTEKETPRFPLETWDGTWYDTMGEYIRIDVRDEAPYAIKMGYEHGVSTVTLSDRSFEDETLYFDADYNYPDADYVRKMACILISKTELKVYKQGYKDGEKTGEQTVLFIKR